MKRRQTEFFRFVCFFLLSAKKYTLILLQSSVVTLQKSLSHWGTAGHSPRKGVVGDIWVVSAPCGTQPAPGHAPAHRGVEEEGKYSYFSIEEGATRGQIDLCSFGAWRQELKAGPCGGFRWSLCFGSRLHPNWGDAHHSV